MHRSVAYSALTEAAKLSCPEVALVLGSGMGPVVERLRNRQTVPFSDIPGLTATSVIGHRGCLSLGDWAGRRVLVFEGRLHLYEGHLLRNIVLPAQTAAFLGAKVLLATNAAGGIHETLGPGSLMPIRDCIDWTKPSCWRSPGPGGLGDGRPSPFSPRLLQVWTQAGRDLGMELHGGVYAIVTGPSYETPAEIRALKAWGADAVGMSTVPEIRAAFDLGMECAALSCITNRAAGLSEGPLNHEEVLTNAGAQSDRLADLLERFLCLLDGPIR